MKTSRFSHNAALTETAKGLRKNMTPEESKLWYQYLRTYPRRILRQKIIDQFIVDFYCAAAKLAIEIDGSQHHTDEGFEKDANRTEMLSLRNVDVIRVSNADVRDNFENVCAYIDQEIQKRIK